MKTSLIQFLPELLAITGIIFFGAIAHAFAAFQKYRKNGDPFSGMDFFILMTLAAFAGTISGLSTYAIITHNIFFVSLFAGLGAFAGMALIDRLVIVLMEILEGFLRSIVKK